MRTLWNDLRYGVRMLAANPGFTAVAILSLAIGIGANTSMFSLADAMLLRPLPVEQSSENGARCQHVADGALRPDFLSRLPRLSRIERKRLPGLVGYKNIAIGFNPKPGTPAQLLLGLAVTTNFFDVLGVRPALGRGFRADEDREAVVVISEAIWDSQFGRDPSVIGRTVKLSKVDFTIIGVAPRSFPGLDQYVHESMYVPFGITPRFAPDEKDLLGHRERLNVASYGRLQPGATAAQAQAEFETIARNLEQAYPDTNRGRSALVMPEIQARMRIDPDDAMQTAILLAIAGLVLLIACANVASLLLARARARSREIAIRLAIGASRARLLRQLLTESLLLALAGGVAGLGLALLGIQFLSSIRFPTALPLWLVAHVDLRVLGFCAAASLLSGVVFGIAPALHTLRTDLSGTLKAGDAALAGKRRRFQIRSVLVVGQVAVSMLVAAGGRTPGQGFR